MKYETCIVSVSFGDPKKDGSALKKADRREIISQVKNWINAWVNYCENGT
jgi:hypothetical protein